MKVFSDHLSQKRVTVFPALVFFILFIGCTSAPTLKQQSASLEVETGLAESVEFPGFLTGERHGYKFLFRPPEGNTGRRPARQLVLGDRARELVVLENFIDQKQDSSTRNQFNGLLASTTGKAHSFYMVLRQKGPKGIAPLLLVGPGSTVRNSDLEKIGSFGIFSASVYGDSDEQFTRLISSIELNTLLGKLHGYSINVNDEFISYVYAGDELTWSNQLESLGGYSQILSTIQATLAKISDQLS